MLSFCKLRNYLLNTPRGFLSHDIRGSSGQGPRKRLEKVYVKWVLGNPPANGSPPIGGQTCSSAFKYCSNFAWPYFFLKTLLQRRKLFQVFCPGLFFFKK